MNLNLDKITTALFCQNAIEILDSDGETDELYDALKEMAHNTISKYGRDSV